MNKKDWVGNSGGVYKTIGASNHTDKEREINDYYATDPIAIDKLLQVEKPSNMIWECAAGEGHIAERLRQNGYNVLTSDIIERNYKLDFMCDFLKDYIDCGFDKDIITNPPYKYAKEFVLRALDLISTGHKVYMFLKLTFLEGKSRYKELFSKYPPKTIYVFSERIMCAKNAQFQQMIDGGGSAVAFAWFVWEKGFKGETVVKWI